jgi:NDP-sugar pyrophosphorylase family protein
LDNKKLLDKSEDLIVTYGDLVSDPDINKLLSRHKEAKNKLGTWTTVMLFEAPKQEARRFGVAWVKSITEDLFLVEKFVEKPTTEELPAKTYVNAGFMVIGKEVYHNLDRYLPAKKSRLEHTILQALPETKELAGCLHDFKIWADIGTIEALEEINEKIYTGKVIIPPPPIQRNMTDIV